VQAVSPIVVEIAVGLVAALVMLGLRLPLNEFVGDRAPYAFMFLGAAFATVLAGWRGGVLAVIAGQLLTWYFVIQPTWSFALPEPEVRGGLVIATISQLLTVLIIALYQREVDKGTREREQRLELLDEALKEIDHRTRNNYQTVLAMIDLQARRAAGAGVREALRQMSDRIHAIASASEQLAARSDELDSVRLEAHLCGLVEQIERGLSREEIKVECEVDDVTASPDTATSISIIVNELVTNALKHAFNGEGSGLVRVLGKSGRGFELIVSDDGRGMDASKRDGHIGLGTKLVDSFARQLGAKHQITSSDKGTTHRLVIPNLA
jgi:two-component sensor histidine kinase